MLRPLKSGVLRKEETFLNPKTAELLRQTYPNHVPLTVASKFQGVSPRQLSKLIADGREPFASIGANIGTRQKYARVYTELLIAYLDGRLLGV